MSVLALVGDPVGGAAAQRAARAELRRAAYDHSEPSLATRAVNWLTRHLDRLFTGGGGSNGLVLLLVIGLVVVIAVALRAGVPSRRARGDSADEDDPLAPVTARDHRHVAAELSAQGRHAEALREWLRAAVHTIEERGVLPPRPGRTGAATAREAGPLLPGAADDLAAATAAFDEIWFGGRPATAADAERGRSAADGVAAARIASGAVPGGLVAPW